MRKPIYFSLLLCFTLLFALTGCNKEADSDTSNTTADDSVTIRQTAEPVSSGSLPVLRLTSDTAYDAVTTENYTNASISIDGTDYSGTSCSYEGDLQIKLRGNSTASRPKKPFKIKLSEKVDLFGMGASKHWVLLANDIDHTQMRNKLLNDFSGAIGTETYMESTWVDLYYNDTYMGVYQLCEQIRVGKTRINIFDWDDVVEDAAEAIAAEVGNDNEVFLSQLEDAMEKSYTWIDDRQVTLSGRTYTIPDSVEIPEATGGFVLEMDFYSESDNSLAKTLTAYRQPLYFNTPEPTDPSAFANTKLYNYAYNYIQSFEYALHSDDFFFRNSDTHYSVEHRGNFDWNTGWSHASYTTSNYTDDANDGKHYSELFDMDSLVNNFIFCEFAMNWDSMKNSFHLYKDLDSLAQIGPQWDFDWAWGNNNMYNINTYVFDQWHTTCMYFTNEQYYQSVQWNTQLIRDPYFLVRAYEKYNKIRPTIIEDMIKDGGTIDQYTEYLKASADANDAKWSYSYSTYSGEKFDKAVSSMTNFINSRVNWLDTQFSDLDTFINSLGVYKTSDKLCVDDMKEESDGTVTITASVTDDTIKTITFQVNGVTQIDGTVENGQATVTVPKAALTTDASQANVVEIKAKDSEGKYLYDTANSKSSIYNLVISNYATWN
jgi:hypothetical protein